MGEVAVLWALPLSCCFLLLILAARVGIKLDVKGLPGGYLSPQAIKRRSLTVQLLPPNSGYELPTTFIRGK